VRRLVGITSVVLVIGSSSSSGVIGWVEFSDTCRASRPSGDVGSPADCELVGEDGVDYSVVVDVMREVYVDLVGAGVGVFGRVYAREVLCFEKYWAVCRG